MSDGRCCGCCCWSPSAHPCREAQHPFGCPPQPRSSLVRLWDVSPAGCSTWGRLSPEVAVRCMPTLGVSGKVTGAIEGGRDPAALQLCLPQGAAAAAGQPQPDIPPWPPSTKKTLLLFFSPLLNRAKHSSLRAGKMEPLSPARCPHHLIPLSRHTPPFWEQKKKEIIKFLFPPHLPFPGLSKECHKSDKLKATDYCGFMAFILLVKRANIRNNVVRPALEPNPAINQHSCTEGARASDMQRGSN